MGKLNADFESPVIALRELLQECNRASFNAGVALNCTVSELQMLKCIKNSVAALMAIVNERESA